MISKKFSFLHAWPAQKNQDLLDFEEIQITRKAFAKASGAVSVVTDTNCRPITKPLSF